MNAFTNVAVARFGGVLLLLAVVVNGCASAKMERYVVSTNSIIMRITKGGEQIPHTGSNLKFYFTDDGTLTQEVGPDEIIVLPEKIREAELAPESRPVSQNPAGGWGYPSQGLQLKLSFSKKSFHAGEPLLGTLTIRNVGMRTEHVEFYSPDILTKFEITKARGEQVHARSVVPPVTFQERLAATPQRMYATSIVPGTQKKFEINLNEEFDLQPGDYVVRCYRRPTRNQNESVISGKAAIRVFAKRRNFVLPLR